MTLLVTSIEPNTLAEAHTLSRSAFAAGADAVELRIDSFQDDLSALAAYLAEHEDCTWIVTCRTISEGGKSPQRSEDRARNLKAATRDSRAYIDFEFAERRSFVGESIPVSRMIWSMHDLVGLPDAPRNLCNQMLRSGKGAVAKIAYGSDDSADSFIALDLMRELGSDVIAICMGESGRWTRLLARKLGAFASYSALTPDAQTAPGQWTLREMIETYRWPRIGAATRVFGVLGDPVRQSLSPLLFNYWFEDTRQDAIYVPIWVSGRDLGFSRFLAGIQDRPWLDVGGLSVTHPHKGAAYEWIGTGADRTAEAIGAVNTLVFDGSEARGFNTDCNAAIASLVDALGATRRIMRRLPVDVLGTGGAARAILSGLRDYGCAVTLFGRSSEVTGRLSGQFGCQAADWEERGRRRGEVLINCTSMGMWPRVDESPMPPVSLTGCRLVFDMVYNPLTTKLLRDAASQGLPVLNGLDMFIRQAATQFELWLKASPDPRSGKALIETALSGLDKWQ